MANVDPEIVRKVAEPSPDITLSLHGPGVTIDDAIDAGAAMKDLFDAVARSMGATEAGWQVVSVQFQCDRCGLLRADRPGPDEGWTHSDGDDLCPVCTALAARAATTEESQ